MEFETVWSGAIERAAIVSQQQPAPVTPPVDRAPVVAQTWAILNCPAHAGRQWSVKELGAALHRDMTSIATALRRLVAEGLVARVITGQSMRNGIRYRYMVAQQKRRRSE